MEATKRRLLCASLALLAGGCRVEPAPVLSLARAVGEPQNGFPTPDERLGLLAINRARSDPATVKGPQSTIYPARPPVLWNYDLSRSSRFHAINLLQSNTTLMHTSPCTLNPNVGTSGCTGDPNCACQSPVPSMCSNCANVAAMNNCGTDPFTRIGYFTNIATGEVVAAGYSDTWAAVDGWVTEPAGADGHRTNLLDQGIQSDSMGFGHSEGNGCFNTFDVSDSGMAGVTIPLIPTAATQPAHPTSGAATRFWSTYADPNSGAPKSLWVVIDGQCTSLQKELGTETLNSTWYADVSLSTGCHTWYVLAHDGGGGRDTYPTTGALTVSVDNAPCSADSVAQAPPASCEGAAPPPDLSMTGTTSIDLSMTNRGSRDLSMNNGGNGGAATGASCRYDSDCRSGLCAIAASGGYCTVACDPANASSCPSGMQCGPIGNASYCLFPDSGGSGGGCSIARNPQPTRVPLLAILLLTLCIIRRRLVH